MTTLRRVRSPPRRSCSSTATASACSARTGASRRATAGRSTRSIEASCSASCTARCAIDSAPSAITPATPQCASAAPSRARGSTSSSAARAAALGRAEGEVVVACDGIHSVVRAQLQPDEGPPLWNGITMWRAVTEREPLFDGRTMMLVGHMERRMVIYPISRKLADEGRSLVNWVAELKTAPGQPMPKQDWEFRADPEEAATRVRRLPVRLARRARAHPRRTRGLPVPDGRP